MVKRSMAAKLPHIVFENDDYWVIEKPAGWLSVPARHPQASDHVLTDWLSQAASSNVSRSPDSPRVFTVHRLDRFTSGVMLYAKSEAAHEQANAWFMNRTVKKIYEFLAAPIPSRPALQIKTPVHGKPAQTLFEVIQKFEVPGTTPYFWGRATPLTGRFHQIREHARDAGFPILGDPSTGGLRLPGVYRVCLHASALTLPFGTFEVPFPAELKIWESKV